ncbi:amidohydrolase [Actinophytocola xinjiangensis]|uniref:Amidohydrolase n=1 Tax=Actinophytocola xinjiangensis TaxID=485602 RepID=A0A7Z1AUM0_9PSEU|nr:amidohydrolase family protein [Actinophytocola xinjiangensis]OLF06214.1 amidohydrolase [Actinophytocola xinjiangensis]
MAVTDDVVLVDQHCHGVLVTDVTAEEFAAGLTEADTAGRPDRWRSMLGLAVRRWCAPVLDLPAHATPAEYLARRNDLGWREVTRRLLRAAGVGHWFVDTGYATDTSPTELADLGGGTGHEVLRVEQVLEDTTAGSATELLDRVGAALRASAAVAFKSVVGYRGGLGLPARRPSERDTRQAAERWLRGGTRLTDPVLHAWLVHEAATVGAETGRALQFHTGFGDADLHLHRADPLALTDFLRARRDVDVVLLHCWPYHRGAAYLAHVFDTVSVDLGLMVPFAGARTGAVIAETLELAPFESVRYSSDGNLLPEIHHLGAVLWRHHLGRLLDEWIGDGVLTAADAERLAHDVGGGNALRSAPHLLGDLDDQR